MKRVLVLAAIFAAGCAAALSLGVHRASAWDWMSLPSGYSVSGASDGLCPDGTSTRHWITVNGTEIFPSTCDAGFQAALDAYVDSTICTVNPTAGGAMCAPSTTAPATTTTETTTPVTTTETTQPTTTTAPATTTVPDPPPPPVVTTVGTTTLTVTAPLSPVEQSLSDQIATLAAQIQGLTDRVTLLEKASDAAWLAFQQALESGSSPQEAAMIARGTALNVLYGLGDFAP